jgi:hypothetical protein
VQDGYAYVAGLATGLHVIDVSDPNWPIEVGYFPSEAPCLSVVAEDKYVYLTDSEGLWIVDVANPVWPIAIARYPQASTKEAKVRGDYAYLVCHRPGLEVLDISDKTRPTQVTSVNYYSTLSAGAKILSLSEDYLYLACHTSTAVTQAPGLLAVLAISKPSLPREILTYKLPGQPPTLPPRMILRLWIVARPAY